MPMKQITIRDRELQTVQQNAGTAIAALETSSVINIAASTTQPITAPFTGGHILANLTLTSGQDNLVAHKLSRLPQVWVLTNNNTNSVLWSPVSAQLNNQSSTTEYINFQVSNTTIVSLWVA